MSWQQSLDRYLTTEPDNGFTDYYEKVFDLIPEEIYQAHQEFFDAEEGRCNDLMNQCFTEGLTEEQATILLVTESQNSPRHPMIKASDLRLKNWIAENGDYYQVENIGQNIIHVKRTDRTKMPLVYEELIPIKLTQKILTQAGFEISSNGHEWIRALPFGNGCDLSLEDATGDFTLPLDPMILRGKAYCYLKSLHYVHDLQNLYYTLTKDELPIDLLNQDPQ